MKKILYVLLVSCIGLTIIISCSSSSDEDDIVEITTTDTTAATLAEVTAVTTPTNDSTPDYTFSSSEAGTITYGGSCSSSTTSATTGDNTITRLFILKELAFLLIGLVFLTASIQV